MTARSIAAPRSSRTWMGAAACVAMLSVASDRPRAQTTTGVTSVEEAIAATLRENLDIRIARADVDASRGALLQTARPFDARPVASLTNGRSEQSSSVDINQPVASYSAFQTESRLGISKMLRSGVTLTIDAAMTRTSLRALGRFTANEFSTTTGLILPLMQGRGGGVLRAAERAAAVDMRASARSLRATASAAVTRTTVAYWEYRAAFERAAIQRVATARALQSVEEVKILIAADERPQSDIDLMVANAATKQVRELEADRQIVHARNALALAIGLDLDGAAALGEPATAFPDAEASELLTLDTLIADALALQDHLAVASMQQDSARLLRDGAASQMKPRVDLLLATGYTGQNRGSTLGRTFGSVFGDVLGPNVSMSIVFEPSRVNSSLRGAFVAASADYSEAVAASDRLTRAIRVNVSDALVGLTSTRAQLTGTREAVARARKALETVQRNFELGAATLFDRILAEDTVTNAEIADLNAALQYATALVNLQFARGVLIDSEGANLAADPSLVLRARREDAR